MEMEERAVEVQVRNKKKVVGVKKKKKRRKEGELVQAIRYGVAHQNRSLRFAGAFPFEHAGGDLR